MHFYFGGYRFRQVCWMTLQYASQMLTISTTSSEQDLQVSKANLNLKQMI